MAKRDPRKPGFLERLIGRAGPPPRSVPPPPEKSYFEAGGETQEKERPRPSAASATWPPPSAAQPRPRADKATPPTREFQEATQYLKLKRELAIKARFKTEDARAEARSLHGLADKLIEDARKEYDKVREAIESREQQMLGRAQGGEGPKALREKKDAAWKAFKKEEREIRADTDQALDRLDPPVKLDLKPQGLVKGPEPVKLLTGPRNPWEKGNVVYVDPVGNVIDERDLDLTEGPAVDAAPDAEAVDQPEPDPFADDLLMTIAKDEAASKPKPDAKPDEIKRPKV